MGLNFLLDRELERVVTRAARAARSGADAEGAREIAGAHGVRAGRRTVLRRGGNFSHVAGDGVVTRTIADAALTRLEVDALGSTRWTGVT